MSSPLPCVPLVPLPLVVAPGERVALHIFEARYKALIARCRKEAETGGPAEFVIALSLSGDVAKVGTAVRIERILAQYADGRLDLVARGARRVRVEATQDVEPYRTALVEHWPDTDPDWDEALATRVVAQHRRLIKLTCEEEPGDSAYHGKASLAFELMPTSGLRPLERQRMLEMQTENARLRYLEGRLEQLLRSLQDAVELMTSIRAGWDWRSISADGENSNT